MATLSAVVGLVVSYGAALITARSNFINEKKFAIEAIALITNTIPGMVIGIAYMMFFFRNYTTKYFCFNYHL